MNDYKDYLAIKNEKLVAQIYSFEHCLKICNSVEEISEELGEISNRQV